MTEEKETQPPHHEDHIVPPSFLERYHISPVLFLLGALLVIFVLYQIIGGTLTLLFVGSKVTRENVLLHRVFTIGGQIVFILVPTLIFARIMSGRLSTIFPWRMPHLGETVFASLSLLFLQQVFQTYLFFQDHIPIPEELSKIIEPFKEMLDQMVRVLVTAESLSELALVVLVVAVVPAVVEEMLFRGLIQTGLERITAPTRAALIAGAIFGAFHFNPFAIVPLVGLGCFFGFLRMRSKSIVIAMTVHFLNNVTAVTVAYFKIDDQLLLSGMKETDMNVPIMLTQLFLFGLLFVVSFSTYLRLTSALHEPKGERHV